MGRGKLFKATDESRIEQVGIENMRAISDFDPSKTDTKMDNDVLDSPITPMRTMQNASS